MRVLRLRYKHKYRTVETIPKHQLVHKEKKSPYALSVSHHNRKGALRHRPTQGWTVDEASLLCKVIYLLWPSSLGLDGECIQPTDPWRQNEACRWNIFFPLTIIRTSYPNPLCISILSESSRLQQPQKTFDNIDLGVVNENKVKILKIEEIEFEAKKHLVLGSETLVEPELMSRELLLSWKNTYLFFVLTKTVQHMSESSIRQFIEKYYPKYYSTETYPASECVRIHKITEPWSPNKHQWRYQGSCRCHQRWAWQAA